MLQRQPLILFLFAAVLLSGCRPPPPAFMCTDAIGCVNVAPGDPIQYGDCDVARFRVVRLDDPAAGLAGLAAKVAFAYPTGP